MSDRLRPDGKVAIVTSAGGGLGRAYAQALASAGRAVIVNDIDRGPQMPPSMDRQRW